MALVAASILAGCNPSSTPTDVQGTDATIDDMANAVDAPAPTAAIASAAVEPAAQSSMVASALASLLAEVASYDPIAAFLSLRTVPQGDVRDTAPNVTDRALTECVGAGTESLARCPATIVCGTRRALITWGDGCVTPSGRRLRGFVRITASDLPARPWVWEFAVSYVRDTQSIQFAGTLGMTRSGTDLLFNHSDAPLVARLPTGTRDVEARRFDMMLDRITLRQAAGGDYTVDGPHTFTLNSVPIQCGTGDAATTVNVSLTVSDCGGWNWPVPLPSCICPVSGNLRVTGPLLTACTNPASLQTLEVVFRAPTMGATCGSNLSAILYLPSTQCGPSCGMCNRGLCLGSVCTNSVDLSATVSGLVGWVCSLPTTICGAIADAGGPSCTDGGVRIDAARD